MRYKNYEDVCDKMADKGVCAACLKSHKNGSMLCDPCHKEWDDYEKDVAREDKTEVFARWLNAWAGPVLYPRLPMAEEIYELIRHEI